MACAVSFPKGRTRAQEKRSARAERNARIKAVRGWVVTRDLVCRLMSLGLGACEGRSEMDELTPRSALRNRPPAEIFNLENCWLLCSSHHRAKTERRLRIGPMCECGTAGPVIVLDLTTGQTAVSSPRIIVTEEEGGARVEIHRCQVKLRCGTIRCLNWLSWQEDDEGHMRPSCPVHGPQEVHGIVCGLYEGRE